MKASSRNRFPAVSLALAALSASAWADDRVKQDNTTLLDLAGSWDTLPGTGDVATWSGIYNTTNSLSAAFTANTPVSWQGIKVGNLSGTAAGLVSIGGTGNAVTGSSVTVGTSGIDLSAANQNLVINAATINFTGNQTWNTGTGRNLRFGASGTGAGNANVDGTATITISGSSLVDANQGGGTGFADAAGFAGFSGKWIINSGATLRGSRNGATAWGTSTAADAITLNGGTLAVGGISTTQGNWTWNTPITLTTSTTSAIDQQIFSGSPRSLKLMGAITGDTTTNLIFKETGAANCFDNDDRGYIIAVDNPNLAGTVTIWGAGATENNNAGRLSSVRVGGVNGATDTSINAGTAGTLGTAAVVNNGVLTLSRSDTWTFANNMSGSGSLRIGGGVTGAGTQVVTVSGNNTHSGGTTLFAGVTLKIGSANALGSGTFSNGGGGTFDNNTGSALSIANAFALSGGSPTFTGTDNMTISGPVTISNITAGQTRTITVSAKTLTLSDAITESVAGLGLTKAGPGTLTLSSAESSFTGLVTLAGGITNVAKLANIGSNSSLGAGNALYTIRFNGGTLNYTGTGGDTTDRTIELQTSGAINNNGSGTIAFTATAVTHFSTASPRTLTLGGTYSGGANTFGSSITDSGTGANITSLVKNGASLWTLGGANSYTGSTTIIAGTLEIGASGSLASTTVNVTGGTLKPADTTSGGFANNTAISVSSGALLDLSSAASFALGSTMSLNAGRTGSPATDVNGTLTSGGAINPAASGTKGTLSVDGGLSLTGGSLNLDLTAADTTVGGGVNDLILATGGLSMSGSTTVNVTWTGLPQPGSYTLISAGSLGLGDPTNLAKGAGLTNLGRFSAAFDTTTTPGTVKLDISGAPLALTWVGDGVANGWDIGTTGNWNNGTGADNFFNFDTVTFNDSSANGTVNLTTTVTPGSVTVSNSSTAYTFSGSGAIAGTGSLSKSGTASLTLLTANTYTGGTTLADGTLVLGHASAIGTGPLTITGGSLDSALTNLVNSANNVQNWNGDFAFTGTQNLNLGTGAVTMDANRVVTVTANTLTVGGVIGGSGFRLTKSGNGALTLTNANTYSGGTTLNAGILRVGNNSALGTGTLTINGGIVSSDSGTIRTLANNLVLNTNPGFGDGTNGGQLVFDGTVDLQSATRTFTSVLGTQGARFNGVISNGGITKAGGGRVTLANDTNTFDGPTTIDAGILATSTGALASSASVTIGSLGQLALGSNGTTIINNLSGVAGSLIVSNFSINTDGARTLEVNQTVDGEFAGGNTQGSGRVISLIKSGSATLTLSGTGSYTGPTTVNAGTLKIGGAGVLGSGNYAGNITINATLDFDSSANQTLSGLITGSGSLLKSGSGTLILTNNNDGNNGSITINGGALQVGNNGTAGFIGNNVTVVNNSALVWFRLNDTNVGNSISGTGSLTKLGAGRLNLNGNSTYTGDTTVTTGTLAVAGSLGNTAVTVGDQATLAGNGNIGGSVTIQSGGTHSLAVAATSGAQVTRSITRTLTLATGNILTLTAAVAPANGTYILATASEGISGDLGTVNLPVNLPRGVAANVTKTSNSLVLTISPTFLSWIDGFFPGVTDSAIIGAGADPDADGIPNAVEMIIGGNPKDVMDTALLPTIELVTNPVGNPDTIPPGDYLLFTYRRTAVSEAAGVTAGCETDTDLTPLWTLAVNGDSGVVIQEDLNFTFTPEAPAAPADTDRVRVYVPRGANSALFGRLKVQVP